MELIGEICVKSPSAARGYWRNQEATEKAFQGEWLHMGDLARLDSDGYLWFVGRKKLMIGRRGSNVAPAEIENVLDRYPKVHASVVVGGADPWDGQIRVAWGVRVDVADPPTEVELSAFVRQLAAESWCSMQPCRLRMLSRHTPERLMSLHQPGGAVR